jgi:Co/Zn/Cd efflux system component
MNTGSIIHYIITAILGTIVFFRSIKRFRDEKSEKQQTPNTTDIDDLKRRITALEERKQDTTIRVIIE